MNMKMMTKRNTIILMVTAILAVPILLLSGIANVSTYLSDALVINNSQGPSTSSSPSSLPTNTALSSPNWVGSIQVSNALSQMIQSKVHTTLGNAAAGAEKAVGINSHATSANLGEERGYLVYTIRVMDGNSNSHKVIVDPGNGRVLFDQSVFNDQEELFLTNLLASFLLAFVSTEIAISFNLYPCFVGYYGYYAPAFFLWRRHY